MCTILNMTTNTNGTTVVSNSHPSAVKNHPTRRRVLPSAIRRPVSQRRCSMRSQNVPVIPKKYIEQDEDRQQEVDTDLSPFVLQTITALLLHIFHAGYVEIVFRQLILHTVEKMSHLFRCQFFLSFGR